MKPFKEQNYYEVLEVSPDALPLEIRRAYKNPLRFIRTTPSQVTLSFRKKKEKKSFPASSRPI
jgi:hypothetical protein